MNEQNMSSLNVRLWQQALQNGPHCWRAERPGGRVAVAGQSSLQEPWACLWCLHHISQVGPFSRPLLRHQKPRVSHNLNIHSTHTHVQSRTLPCLKYVTPRFWCKTVFYYSWHYLTFYHISLCDTLRHILLEKRRKNCAQQRSIYIQIAESEN